MSHDHLVNIEAKLAFLEKDIADLGRMVLAQQRQIDELEKQLRVAAGRLRQMQELVQESPGDDVPPHY